MITSDGFTVPIEDEAHFAALAYRLTQGTFFVVDGYLTPVGRTEYYQRIQLPSDDRHVDVLTSWTDRETAIDASGPFSALWGLLTDPDPGDEVTVQTRKIALPVRVLRSDFVGPINLPPDLKKEEAEKRQESASSSYGESKRQLERDLTRIVTPDASLFEPGVSWLVAAGVLAAVFAAVVLLKKS